MMWNRRFKVTLRNFIFSFSMLISFACFAKNPNFFPLLKSRKKLTYKVSYYPSRTCRTLLRRKTALRYVRRKRNLEYSIRRYIRALRLCRILKHHDFSRILVYDYGNCKLVAINQNRKTAAASLIKTYVMFALYHQYYNRGISARRFPRKLQRHINRMMRVSSNYATNKLIKVIGKGSARRGLAYINRVLRKYGIRNTRLLELIPRGGKTYRNYTSARDISKLLYKIFKTHPISLSYSEKMLQVMLKSRDNRGKTRFLRRRFGVVAATKTGYTRMTNGVSGIILDGSGMRNASYNFVAILTRPFMRKGEWRWRKISTKIIQRLSEMTFQYYFLGFAKKFVKRNGGRKARRLCAR